MKARMVDNLLQKMEEFFGKEEGHRNDPVFMELCSRISGNEVELVFMGSDAFEKNDKNYWLPSCCWTPI